MDDHEISDSSSDEFYQQIKAQLNHMEDEEKSSRIVSKNEVLPKVQFAPPETKEQREINFSYKHTDRIQLIGKIESITRENIIIYSNLLEFVINLDQLLVNSQQEILGRVDDVFGKVERPHYSILLDGYVNNLIQTNQLKIGDDVFINIDNTSVLNPEAIRQLLNKKGCDASNQFDEEVLNECDVEYSDDEIEASTKRKGNKDERQGKKNNKKEKHHRQQKNDGVQQFPQQKNKQQVINQQSQQQQQQMMQIQNSLQQQQQQQQYYQQIFLQQQMQLQIQQQQQYQQLIQNQQSIPQKQIQQSQYIQQIYSQPQQLQPNPQFNLPYNTQQINQQLNQNLNSLFQNIKPQDQ